MDVLCDNFSTGMYLNSYVTWKKSWISFSGEIEKHIKTFIADFLLKKEFENRKIPLKTQPLKKGINN